ncbi:hypothetical protein [Streptosporangium sp. NPDC049046]|uniref:hypothetical protein n=1 Tax=Streptosporangium sp. NPDC049046 TaxID=3155031 RepID=UPI00341FB837
MIYAEDNDRLIGDDTTDVDDADASMICHVRHAVDLDPTVEQTSVLLCAPDLAWRTLGDRGIALP